MTGVRRSWGVVLVIIAGWLVAAFLGATCATAEQEGQPLTDQDRVFLARLQEAVATDNRSWIADHVRYPIDVTIDGTLTNVERADDFLARYDKIMNQRVRDAILAQGSEALFKNWQGTMIGDGEVWFFHALEGSYLCREVQPPRNGVKLDCTMPDPARRWSPPRTGIVAINNEWPQPKPAP